MQVLQVSLVVLLFLQCRILYANRLRVSLVAKKVVTKTNKGTKKGGGVALGNEVEKKKISMIETVSSGVSANFDIIKNGVIDFIGNFKKAQKLKGIRKKKGETALSYTDYRFLEDTKDDMGKSLRLAITFPFSPEFFFYSYIVFPMMSSDNPWAWRAFPSCFDTTAYKLRRQQALIKRRMQTVIFTLQTLQNDVIDDVASPLRQKRQRHMDLIVDALKQKSQEAALDVLAPWLVTSRENLKKMKRSQLQQVNYQDIPGKVVKECCKAFGSDGLPNIPLINRFNRGELNKQLNRIRNSDEFVLLKGVNSLSDSEIQEACHERMIPVTSRKTGQLRKDLEQYFTLVTRPSTQPPSLAGGLRGRTNYQAKRLALLSLNAIKCLQTSEYGASYRCLMC